MNLHENVINANVIGSWPFAQWGVDLIGPFPLARVQMRHVVAAVDYFTKWVEAEPLATITKAKTSNFLWWNVICRFGIPYAIVTDNGRQFDNSKFRAMCSQLEIKNFFLSLAHPQANSQVESIKKIIKKNIKSKLDAHKGAWVEELLKVLWAYRTTARTSTGETPFSLVFGVEAIIPVEIGIPSFRVDQFQLDNNKTQLRMHLDLLEE